MLRPVPRDYEPMRARAALPGGGAGPNTSAPLLNIHQEGTRVGESWFHYVLLYINKRLNLVVVDFFTPDKGLLFLARVYGSFLCVNGVILRIKSPVS